MALFDKKIEPRCAYCARCRPLSPEEMACPKKGVVPASGSCRAFRYDPLKRVPPRPARADFSGYQMEDFVL